VQREVSFMKKILSLILPIGMLLIIFIIIFYAPGSKAASINLPTEENRNNPEQVGPPWYDEAWHYRRPVVITNNGASLTYYQVLVTLDSSNFNFSRAKNDGSDIRFTHSDGTTELKYWIESWDSGNQLAYIWVRVPSLGNGNTNIYLYYNNPQATAVSDGVATFDSFEDDWSQFAGEGFINQSVETLIPQSPEKVNSPFVWSIISGSPSATAGILSLKAGDGIKSNSTYLYNAVGMRANFGLGDGYEWGGFINENSGEQTMIGDLSSDPGNLYLIDYRNAYDNVLLPRVGGNDWHNGYHVFEVRWNLGQSIGDIDHGVVTVLSTQPSQVPKVSLPVTLYSYIDSNATLKVDWVYVRQYRDPEPTSTVSAEQGLVELSINNSGSPNPIKSGARLTYQLIISNTSTINAPGVVVTDTLPTSVQLGRIKSSQGSCEPGSVILCDLNIILANSTASVTIIVTPTVDGEIINSASVGSPGYELDLSDNTSEQTTLVDSVPPVVNWEKPVETKNTYIASGGWVTLEASATDNDQVAFVEFSYWDHVHGRGWVSMGIADAYPYQVAFDSSKLEITAPSNPYQVKVEGVDRAGNRSNPYQPVQIIYILRRSPVYLPLMRR
jgi:uncharacterized repeat protein (TIGR01451 family)